MNRNRKREVDGEAAPSRNDEYLLYQTLIGTFPAGEVDDEALVARIAGRFACASCGEGYHDVHKTPRVAGVCDRCGGTEFTRRPDDNEQTVRTRMAEYRAKTAPIIPIYESRGLVRRVDGMAEIGAVTGEIESILASR